jgi:hypothetical protein
MTPPERDAPGEPVLSQILLPRPGGRDSGERV